MWRVVAAGLTEPARRDAAGATSGTDPVLGTTRFYDSTAATMADAPMVDPDRMARGHVQVGPALLVAVDTTVVLPSGTRAVMSDTGYLTVEFD